MAPVWFNAILMASFYSQGMRKLMINKVSKSWKKSNICNFFRLILKYNYKDNDKILKLFNKIKPEELLMTLLIKYDNVLFKEINKKTLHWNSVYITSFLKMLNVNVLDITILENNTVLFNYGKVINTYLTMNNLMSYIRIHYTYPIMKKTNTNNLFLYYNDEVLEIKKRLKNPDVLVLYHHKLNETVNKTLKIYNKLSEDLKCYNSLLYNISFDKMKDLNEYKEEIEFNGCKYKLDSVLLDNYNGGKYTMSGIIHDDEKYIYNGSFNNDCGLLKYNWNIHKNNEFCFNNKKCKLDEVKLLKYYYKNCYSFNKGNRVLIYVKVNNKKLSSINSSIKSFSSL